MLATVACAPPATADKLGEHCDWFKHDNYEDATRIPLLLKPAKEAVGGALDLRQGRAVEQLVEEIDIFPSLLELAGLPVPGDLQGKSWVPLLGQGGAAVTGKERVFSQYPHFNSGDDPRWPNKTSAMGYSMRTARWRYTEVGAGVRSLARSQVAQVHRSPVL